MARWRPKQCRDCGARDVAISLRGLCTPCANRRQVRSAVELVNREGECYEAWAAAMRELMPSRSDRF